VLINGDEDGAPVALYRRLGFRDEVRWTHEYLFRASSAFRVSG
jgi:hypothetical protein